MTNKPMTNKVNITEENNYPKAFLVTGIIMAVLIGLCYFIIIANPPVQIEGTGGILVNYGTSDVGMGSDFSSMEEPSVAEKANKTLPNKVTEAPTTEEKPQEENNDKKIVTQNTEDAPEVSANAKKPSKTVSTQATKAAAKPSINQNALFHGMHSNNGTGEGDGTGNTPGNQGNKNGSTLTNNYDGTGSGNGGNLAMSDRHFINAINVTNPSRRVGRVVVDIQVDKNGNIISAVAGGRGTTITDPDLLRRCEQAVLNSHVNAKDTAPDNQVGKVYFQFNVD
jgi:membrane protein involved in colicin uptake